MVSETDTRTTADAVPECLLLSDADGIIRWASPGTETVLDRDPATLRHTETVQTLLGTAVPDPSAVGADPVSRTLRPDDDRPPLSVTAESTAAAATTVYRCHPLVDQLTLDDVLTRIDDAVVAFDTDWRYTYINDAAEELLDRPRSALLGHVVWDVFPEAVGTDIHEALLRAMRTQEPTTIERESDPLDRWLEIRCFPAEFGVSVYFRDITERREREAALRRERDLTDQLLRVSPVGIAVHRPDGSFVRLNERAEEILEIDRETLVGEPLNEPMWEAAGPDGEPFPDESFPFNVVLRTGEPTFGTEMSIRRRDDSRLWLSVSAAPLFDDDGDIERVVVTFEDISERLQYERELRESEQQFRAVFDGTLDALVLADDEGTYLDVNEAACELYGLAATDLVGRNVAEFAPDGYDVAAAWDAFLDAGTLTGEFPLVRPDGEVMTTDFAATADVRPGLHLSALRDVTEKKRDERRLAAQRDELERLNRINELIREVNRTIVGATDRESIRASVCETLVDSGHFAFAIAARRTTTDGIQVEHAAGLPADVLASFRSQGATCIESSVRRAARENELTVLTDLDDPSNPDALRTLARSHDVRTVGSIPIAYDGVVYGVLTVGSPSETAFTDRERSVFLELGQLIGKAIDAIRTKQLLHASGYQELELAVTARDAPLVELHDRLGAALTVEGVVPVESGQYLVYLAAENATPTGIERAAADIEGIEAVRVVDADTGPAAELRVGEGTALAALLDTGGRLRRAAFSDSIGTFVVDIAADTDVRRYLDRVEQRGVDPGLLAKRDVERDPRPAWEATATALTDRQRAVLEAAYLSGYFAWPRRHTTGEELAASLDIASSTLHQHLRVATEKVLEAYFEADTGDIP